MEIKGLHFEPILDVDLKENSFIILGLCRVLLHRLGVPRVEITRFVHEATSGDRAHLIEVVKGTFETRPQTLQSEGEGQ